MIPFTGFAPDQEEHTQGVISDCSMMAPTLRGMRATPSTVSAGFAALSGACTGAAHVVKLDKTTRLFAATITKLYEGSGGSWTEVGRNVAPASAAAYTGNADYNWSFCQFGDVTIACNLADSTQKSVSSGQFTDLATAPKALVCETVAGFVMLGCYNNGADVLDGLFWSGLYDYTAWTPSVATGCGNLRLLDTPGRINAVRRLGNNAIVYKDNSMYIGTFNAGILWAFQLISGDIGAVSQESVVNIGTAHLFVSNDNIYAYSGALPVPIAADLKEWFFRDLSATYRSRVTGSYDKRNGLVYFYYPSSSISIDRCLVYNVKTGKWGRANRSIEAAVEFISGGYTYASFATAYTAYADQPSVTYGGPFWTAGSPNMSVFGTDHILYTLTGTSTNSSITTGAIGDDATMTLLKRVQPRFNDDPTSGNMTNYYRMTDGASWTQDANINMSSGRFDVLREARWHKVKTDFVGAVEVVGNSYLIVPSGSE